MGEATQRQAAVKQEMAKELCATCAAGTGDVAIDYTVSTFNGVPLIHDILLNFNGVVVSPTASVSVTETAFSGTTEVGQVHVSNPGNLSSFPLDLRGGPYTTITIEKDILLTWSAGGQTSISAINQVVSQVPEPASVLLLGSGVLGLGLWGWQRRREEPSA